MTADKTKRKTVEAKTAADKAPNSVSKILMLVAWLVPGLGHWLLGKRVRAGVFAAIIVAAFVTGVLLDGELAVPHQNSPLSWFFAFGSMGNGALYFIRLLWANGLDGLLNSAFPFGLQGGGNPIAVTKVRIIPPTVNVVEIEY